MNIKEMAKMGGKASAKKRFEGKTKEEVSEIMKKVSLSKANKKLASSIAEHLNKNSEQY